MPGRDASGLARFGERRRSISRHVEKRQSQEAPTALLSKRVYLKFFLWGCSEVAADSATPGQTSLWRDLR